jgi:hypothetical protein
MNLRTIIPRRFVPLLAAALLLASCNLPLSGGEASPTPEEFPTAVPLPTVPPPIVGMVGGSVCYPSEPPLPPMTLYFAETTTGAITAIPHTDGTGIYSIGLPPGTYTAYAYAEGQQIGGSYSEAVLCGLSADCADHSLVSFDVAAGSPTDGIDICDWYGGPGTVPTPPGASSASPLPPTAEPPAGGVSLQCDGTYQRFRITDGGAAGKTASVDTWDGTAWVNVWNWAGGDPMAKQIEDGAGLYSFGSCEQFVVIPERLAGSGTILQLTIHRWTGAGLLEVFYIDGPHASWTLTDDGFLFEESVYLYGEPNCCPCNRQYLQYAWNGSSFDQIGSAVNPTYTGTPPAECTP